MEINVIFRHVVHEDSYKAIFNPNTFTNPSKTHQGVLTLLQQQRKTQLSL